MRRKMAVLTIICLLTAGAGLWAQEGAELPRLAVVEFSTNSDAERVKQDSIAVRNMVETHMVSSGKFTMMSRNEIDNLLAEQRIAVSSISSPENVKKLQLLQISYVVVGNVDVLGTDYSISVKTLNVSTGEFFNARPPALVGGSSREIFNGVNALMSEFISGITSDQIGAITRRPVRTAATGIEIEMSTKYAGILYLQDEEIATLWDNDTYTIPIERPGAYAVKMVFGDGASDTRTIAITTRGVVKVEFLDHYVVGGNGPGGGIVFFDKGNNSEGWQHLEVAPLSTEIHCQWGAINQNVLNTYTAIGSGKQNTRNIVRHLGRREERGKAAQFCVNLDYGGFNDWFLPSKDELALIYVNLRSKGLGDLSDQWYWSSSQSSDLSAWIQSFISGRQESSYMRGKNRTFAVRAVRAF